jgi:hypothetical protein
MFGVEIICCFCEVRHFLVKSGAERVAGSFGLDFVLNAPIISMGGDGGGRASQICRGWRWLVVGCLSLVTALFGLSAGDGFRRTWPRPMRVWRFSMAVRDLGRPGAQVWRTYLVA